ncbi:mannonate dehydratase, partial [Halobium palmae]
MSRPDGGAAPSPRSDPTEMRVGLGQFMEPTEERLRYVKQLGVDDVLLNMYQYDDPDYEHMPDGERMPLEGDGEWSVGNLVALRERVEAA